MPILMITEVPGADAALAEAIGRAGVLDVLQKARGFRGHWSGAACSGYKVTELWDSREDCQAFFDLNIVPHFPLGTEPPYLEFFELNLEIKPAR